MLYRCLSLIVMLVMGGICYGQEITTTNYYNGDSYTGNRDGLLLEKRILPMEKATHFSPFSR